MDDMDFIFLLAIAALYFVIIIHSQQQDILRELRALRNGEETVPAKIDSEVLLKIAAGDLNGATALFHSLNNVSLRDAHAIVQKLARAQCHASTADG